MALLGKLLELFKNNCNIFGSLASYIIEAPVCHYFVSNHPP